MTGESIGKIRSKMPLIWFMKEKGGLVTYFDTVVRISGKNDAAKAGSR